MNKDFGFQISRSRTLDLDSVQNPMDLSSEDLNLELKSCLHCGSCAATCSAGGSTGSNLLRIRYTWMRYGIRDDEKLCEWLKQCYLCGKCQWVCPGGISNRMVLITMMKYVSKT